MLEKLLAGASIVSILTIFGYFIHRTYIASPKRPIENPAERLIAYTFVPVLSEMIGKVMAELPWRNGLDQTSCKAQTSLIEFGNMASVILGLWFAWDLYTIIVVFRRPNDPGRPWNIRELKPKLIKREIFFIPTAYIAGFLFALATIPFAAPKDFWCWVNDTSGVFRNTLNLLVFFYAWMWIVFTLSFFVLAFALIDYIRHRSEHTTTRDIRSGCIASFSSFLIINVVVWALASAQRLYTSYIYFGCYNIPLTFTHPLLACSRGLLLATAYGLLVYNGQFTLEDETEKKGEAVVAHGQEYYVGPENL